MSRFTNVFALSIFRDKIVLASDYKEELTRLIFEIEAASQTRERSGNTAWLGDTRGAEFLFQYERFGELYRQIAAKIRDYTEALGIESRLIDFYFQRSWATVTRRGERIHEHAHVQSNITFAYYLRKPKNSGGIFFVTHDHPNEISPGAFSPAKASLGFISRPSLLTWNSVLIDPEEDDIVIFPSKTLHSTAPNSTDDPRISISADVTTMLRESRGHETMMPHFSQWRSFDAF